MSDPIVITTVQQLQAIQNDLSGSYVLGANIDASGFDFVPIGNASNPFTGTFEGQGYSIDQLHMTTPTYAGLFGYVGTSGQLRDVTLTNVSFATVRVSLNSAGALAGWNDGLIVNSSSSGSVGGSGLTLGQVGGLVGGNAGTIVSSHSSVSVGNSVSPGGGLVGYNIGTIAQSYATGDVTGRNFAISTGGGKVGGLVGSNDTGGVITQSYATGTVNGLNFSAPGNSYSGGLVGINNGTVSRSYAMGATESNGSGFDGYMGGLIAYNTGTVSQSYSTGEVKSKTGGGLIGFTSALGSTSSSYWDIQTSGLSTSSGGTGLSTTEFESGILPTGFDSTIWFDTAGQFPQLQWQVAPPDIVHQGPATTTVLSVNGTLSGTIDAEPMTSDIPISVSDGAGGYVDKDWYQVTLNKGYIYTFGGTSTSITTGLMDISLYDQSGTQVQSAVEGASPTFTLDTGFQDSDTQTYYLAVSAGGPDPAWKTATGDYSVSVSGQSVSQEPTPLFTSGSNTVNFNNLMDAQKQAVQQGADIYHGLGGNDVVTLPDEANYNENVGGGNTLGWTDTAASTFSTGSQVGDTYKVAGGDGSYNIVLGAGSDSVTINGVGTSTITPGTGTDSFSISGGGKVDVVGNFGGSATVGGNSALEMHGAVLGSLGFGPTTGTLKLDQPLNVVAQIDGFVTGDAIDLPNVSFSNGGSAQLTSGNVLRIVNSGQKYDLQLDPSQDFSDESFKTSPDGGGGTRVCLKHGVSINVTYFNSAPAGFKKEIDKAVETLEGTFANPVTINIVVGYGKVPTRGGGADLPADAPAESFSVPYSVDYSEISSQLSKDSVLSTVPQPIQQAAANSLLGENPLSAAKFAIPIADAQALGLNDPARNNNVVVSNNSVAVDGWIGFAKSDEVGDQGYLGVSYESTALHEITEVMGRVAGLGQPTNTAFLIDPASPSGTFTTMDLFRYFGKNSPGTTPSLGLVPFKGLVNPTAYFSIDNGTSSLGTWNNIAFKGDLGDWDGAGPVKPGQDAFVATTVRSDGFGPPILPISFSPNDIALMNAIGWDTAFPISVNDPDLLITSPTGTVIEGYVSGGTVVADANNNGLLDQGEASTTTDQYGNFNLTGGSEHLIAFGGIDTFTGLPFKGQLSAPAGYSVVTPLTTLVDDLTTLGVSSADQRVLAAFGLSPSLDLSNLDPIIAAITGDTAEAAAEVAGAMAYNTVSLIASALVGGGGTFGTGAQDAFSAIAAAIGGSGINLSDKVDVNVLISGIAQSEGLTLGQDVIDSVAAIIAGSNAVMYQKQQDDGTGDALLSDVAAIERVIQGSASNAIQQAGNDPIQLQVLADAFTGTNLDNSITMALSHLGNNQDNTAPTLSHLDDQIDEATAPNGAVALFSATATDLVDGTDPVVFKEGGTVVHSGDTFAIGSHGITATTIDAAGNMASENFTITVQDTKVQDTTPPTLTPVVDQTDEATGASGAVATFSATATDLVDGTDPVVFTDGTKVVHSGDTFGIGTHTITASATDAAGNIGSEQFTIKVQDTTPPTLTPVANLTLKATGVNGAVATFSATATDTVDGTDPIIFTDGTKVVHSGDTFAIGSHTVTATATDQHGNIGSENFTVTVLNTSTVNSGQTLTVLSGKTSGGVLVLSGGTINILSGGTGINNTINKGGTDKVAGTDKNATLNGGTQIISRTGVANNTNVTNGGSQTNQGKTFGTVLNDGTETVSTGGTANNTTISTGGRETINRGGTDIGAHISGGTQVDSGLASGTVILAGSQIVAGTAKDTIVSTGATEIVSSRGTTSNTVLNGGYETVMRGGTANATKINGGALEVEAGGTANGVTFSGDGTLQLDSGSRLTGTISGFHLGDEIDARGLAFNTASSTLSWTQKTTGAKASGILTVKEGKQTQSFTLAGSYTSGNFSATSDGHGGTLITDPPIGSIVTNDSPMQLDSLFSQLTANQSLGFPLSDSTTKTLGNDKEGHLNLSLLEQYAASFGVGMGGHDSMFFDPTRTVSSPPPLITSSHG
jgi:autotransporter passenger strand-loop-strand repeat protein